MVAAVAVVATAGVTAAAARGDTDATDATSLARAAAAANVQEDTRSRPVEATSLLGKPLYRPDVSAAQRAKLEADLAAAQAAYDKNPRDEDAAVWLGRRLAYLGRYRDAIAAFSKGLDANPSSAKLYRHRGHRYVTVREFDRAIADFERAATLLKGQPDEVEADGAPNKYGKPRSTLQSNIWYHLGLAHYLKGDFDKALASYVECMKVSTVNDDMLVATSDWLYMTYRRLNRPGDAKRVLEPITEKMDILENTAYHQRLLMYKGLVLPDALLKSGSGEADAVQVATQGYGVGNWYLVNGDKAKAQAIFERVLTGSSWGAFGFIASEADLARGLK
jgi:tetratricopeptide (TPR) repeat protein